MALFDKASKSISPVFHIANPSLACSNLSFKSTFNNKNINTNVYWSFLLSYLSIKQKEGFYNSEGSGIEIKQVAVSWFSFILLFND